MHLFLQQLGDLLEMEMAGTFNQDQLILEFLEGRRLDKFLGGRVNSFSISKTEAYSFKSRPIPRYDLSSYGEPNSATFLYRDFGKVPD